jgi:hypothetical protein
MKTLSVAMTSEQWRILHAVVMDDPIPRRAAMQVIMVFETAMKAAQEATAGKESEP